MTNDNIQQQQNNETFLTSILDNVLDGIITISAQGTIHSFNKAASKIFGYASAEVIGSNVKMLMPEPYHSEHDGYLHNFVFSGNRKIIGIGREVVGRRKDGSTFPMDLAVSEMSLGDQQMFAGIVRDISERKKSEEDLANASFLSNAVIEGANHLIITTDTQGVILSFNRAAEAGLGYRAEELVGKSTPAVFHDADEIVRRAKALTATDTPVEPGFEVFVALARLSSGGDTHDWTYIRKDGSRFPVSLTVTALRDKHGRITAFLGIATDITERKKVEKLQAQFAAIVQSSTDPIMSKTLDGIVTSWNPAAEKMFGYPEQEMLGQPMARLIPPERAEEEPQILAKIRRGEHIKHFETMRRRKNGEIFPVSVTISPIRDKAGTVIGASKIARDITERNQAIQARIDDETRMGAILNNVLDGIITINERGTVESFNKSAEHIFGYAAAEVIGNNVKMLMPEPYHSEHDGYLHNFVTTGKKKIIGLGRQVVGWRKDGSTFPMDLAVSEIQLGNIRMFTGIVRDITDRVRVERMKSEFISTVSHELRTPLTSIRGSLALIVGGVVGELPAAAKPMLDIAHKNSERLILLVNDILDMAKIEAGKMDFDIQPIKLMPLLKQALDGNRAYAQQFNVSYELDGELSEAMVKADVGRLMQVCANLLSNAAKFSPSGGKVTVLVERIGARIRVAVKDNGPGIADEFKARIFQKFAQADSSDTRKKGGTGLGLSISKVLVEQMGGTLGFESQPHVLTTFYFEFPEWLEDNKPEPSDFQQMQAKKVLVCEDDQDVALLLKMMLEHSGYAVDVVHDAAQAKQLLAQGGYKAMTLDLIMPTQGGMSLLRELRADPVTAGLPVIVVSAKAVEAGEEAGSDELGVIAWITKPINQEILAQAISQIALKSRCHKARVLHVENDADLFHVIEGIAGEVLMLDQAASLAEARRKLALQQYDLVILDIAMPDGSGLDLLRLLKNAKIKIPVLLFSVSELDAADTQQADAVLVKSRTDNAQLLATIKRLIGIA